MENTLEKKANSEDVSVTNDTSADYLLVQNEFSENVSLPYRGLQLVGSETFKGGTSIMYWM